MLINVFVADVGPEETPGFAHEYMSTGVGTVFAGINVDTCSFCTSGSSVILPAWNFINWARPISKRQ